MSIYKRKNSKNYYCEITINGQTIICSTKTNNKSQAKLFENKLRAEIYNENVLNIKPRISIDDAIERYFSIKNGLINETNLLSQIRVLKSQLKRLCSLGRYLDSLTTSSINNLIDLRKADGVSVGTIKVMLTTLKGVVDLARDNGYKYPVNLTVPRLSAVNSRTRYLSELEEKLLLTHLKSLKCLDSYHLVVLLLDSGARLNEIQQLRWEQIDLNSKTIHLWRNKNRTETIIKLTKRSLFCLQERHKFKSKSGLVFPSNKGTLRKTTPKSLQSAYKAIGFEDFCTHCLRHTTASRLIQSRMEIYAVSKLLGHSSVVITQRYAHLNPEYVADQALSILDKE